MYWIMKSFYKLVTGLYDTALNKTGLVQVQHKYVDTTADLPHAKIVSLAFQGMQQACKFLF